MTLSLETIFIRARNGLGLRRRDVLTLLRLNTADQLEELFKTARQVRQKFCGDRIFLYGFLYISTHCRNNCRFCKYRRDNLEIRRYRKHGDQIVSAADRLAASGVHLIDLTLGEDPQFIGQDADGKDRLVSLVGKVRKTTGLPIMVSPGVVSQATLNRLADAGADWYACYQETHSRDLFQCLRSGQDYTQRMAAKNAAHRAGLLIEEGIICDIGESDRQVADSLDAMSALNAAQVRVMNFVPQQNTPLALRQTTGNLRERMIIAILRLAFPDKLIPASLDIEGLVGLKYRLDSGANVVTSLVPPAAGFSGVAGSDLDIDNAGRTVPAVRRVIASCRLTIADPEDYRQTIARCRPGEPTRLFAGRRA